MYDVVIIGAGVSGSAIARELSRYQVNACVVEKAEDVCCGTSKANSAIVHAGFDAENGSLMADLNVKGLAERAGVSRVTITSVKSGKSCSKTTVQKLAAGLGVQVSDIVSDSDT